jgi:hypothetical protein
VHSSLRGLVLVVNLQLNNFVCQSLRLFHTGDQRVVVPVRVDGSVNKADALFEFFLLQFEVDQDLAVLLVGIIKFGLYRLKILEYFLILSPGLLVTNHVR